MDCITRKMSMVQPTDILALPFHRADNNSQFICIMANSSDSLFSCLFFIFFSTHYYSSHRYRPDAHFPLGNDLSYSCRVTCSIPTKITHIFDICMPWNLLWVFFIMVCTKNFLYHDRARLPWPRRP